MKFSLIIKELENGSKRIYIAKNNVHQTYKIFNDDDGFAHFFVHDCNGVYLSPHAHPEVYEISKYLKLDWSIEPEKITFIEAMSQTNHVKPINVSGHTNDVPSAWLKYLGIIHTKERAALMESKWEVVKPEEDNEEGDEWI